MLNDDSDCQKLLEEAEKIEHEVQLGNVDEKEEFLAYCRVLDCAKNLPKGDGDRILIGQKLSSYFSEYGHDLKALESEALTGNESAVLQKGAAFSESPANRKLAKSVVNNYWRDIREKGLVLPDEKTLLDQLLDKDMLAAEGVTAWDDEQKLYITKFSDFEGIQAKGETENESKSNFRKVLDNLF